MKREATIGAAAFLAIAAVVGISVQPGSKQDGAEGSRGRPAASRQSGNSPHKSTECDELREHLEDFLDIQGKSLPTPCDQVQVESAPLNTKSTAGLKFVIATLPDPRHTHLSVSFDESTATIQEAAQDEGYDFDSSWLPWEQEEQQTYLHLGDQKQADQELEDREKQPGVLLFRRIGGTEDIVDTPTTPVPLTPAVAAPSRKTKNNNGNEKQPNTSRQGAFFESYPQGLVVFVVGEDATHGIHKHQFRNALKVIEMLGAQGLGRTDRIMILGPSFSGSFPSLAELLSDPDVGSPLNLSGTKDSSPLPIYSGAVSGGAPAIWFQRHMDKKDGNTNPRVIFHSFVEDDDQILERFANYMHGRRPSGFDDSKLAILSEDETAYGNEIKVMTDEPKAAAWLSRALKLYYPRDISALRGAYQTKSLFDSTPSEDPQNQQRRNLPTDLADPAGAVHDSVRTYATNQTPLLQEAFLLQIVTALRERGVRYILLRGSNPLDQLFLTNFLRRLYPDARIVIVTSDLMFIRERGATGLSGVMTLSTYPLSSLARHWAERPRLPANDRVFSSDASEALYNALRLLLNARRLDGQPLKRCQVQEPSRLFLPPVLCAGSPIDDYAPPLWINSSACTETEKTPICSYPGPPVWLSVIGVNRFWPLVSLAAEPATAETPASDDKNTPSQGTLGPPLLMKLFLLTLLGFSLFHLLCCWGGSYMAKPSFRAYFAASGDPKQITLISLGSSLVAFLGIVAAWSCGVFARASVVMPYPWLVFGCAVAVGLLAWAAAISHNYRVYSLSPASPAATPTGNEPENIPADQTSETNPAKIYHRLSVWASGPWYRRGLTGLFPALAITAFILTFVAPLESVLLPENRVLTYWRSMNLASGLSPILPFFSLFIGLYTACWYALHGLALFGPDRPCLPPLRQLEFVIPPEEPSKEKSPATPGKESAGGQQAAKKEEKLILRMFSQEAADEIEFAGTPLALARTLRIPQTENDDPKGSNPQKTNTCLTLKAPLSVFLLLLFGVVSFLFAGGVPIHSLGHMYYAIVFLFWFLLTVSLMLATSWRLYRTWGELRRLLEYLDRMPLRRTMEALRGFSWGSVWRMSGNVLEVRYKLISRQLESMNHTIASLKKLQSSDGSPIRPELTNTAMGCLEGMRIAGHTFTRWYLQNYTDKNVRELSAFGTFQKRIADVCGCLMKNLLMPAWMVEDESLVLVKAQEADGKEASRQVAPLAKEESIRNAEEFVCLTYMGFVQNILGRLRTMAISIVALFVSCCIAISAYPFDPRQSLSAVLIALFILSSAAIVFVYAGMHRDATLSHVTNTTPGELGSEFWVKLLVFGAPSLLGLLARVFPGMTDFFFAWLQPGLSSLK